MVVHKIAFIAFVLLMVFAAAGGPVAAQDPSVSDIVDALKPKKPLTRTFQKVDTRQKLLDRGIRIDRQLPRDVERQEFKLTIGFEFDSDRLTMEGRRTVEILAKALGNARVRDTLFQIAGHTDASGDAEYNLRLSQRRAQTVAMHLAGQYGIDPQQLTAVGYGEMQPLDPNSPFAAENRRVVVISLDSILDSPAN